MRTKKGKIAYSRLGVPSSIEFYVSDEISLDTRGITRNKKKDYSCKSQYYSAPSVSLYYFFYTVNIFFNKVALFNPEHHRNIPETVKFFYSTLARISCKIELIDDLKSLILHIADCNDVSSL